MKFLSQLQAMYGVRPEPPILYGPPNMPPARFLSSILELLSNPVLISAAFIVGVALYLATHKKLFLILPLLLVIIYLIRVNIGAAQ